MNLKVRPLQENNSLGSRNPVYIMTHLCTVSCSLMWQKLNFVLGTFSWHFVNLLGHVCISRFCTDVLLDAILLMLFSCC